MNNKDFYNEYMQVFLTENSKVNLISKNDEKFLWEKHIVDSLSIEKFFKKYKKFKPEKLLDIGTGGGFPAIPIALTYPKISVYALDSIRKKIFALERIKQNLDLKNLHPICIRVEDYDVKFDFITSRAVASFDKISDYALAHLNIGGYFVAYKSKKVDEEIKNSKNVLKKYNSSIIDIIEYDLPLQENYTRNLVIVKKNK